MEPEKSLKISTLSDLILPHALCKLKLKEFNLLKASEFISLNLNQVGIPLICSGPSYYSFWHLKAKRSEKG